MKKTAFNIGYAVSVASAFFYALQVVLGKSIMNLSVKPLDLLVIQYTGSTVILFILLCIRRKKAGGLKPEKKDIPPMLIQGVLGCCGTSFFFYLCLQKTVAGISSMLLYMCPIYVCIFFMITGIRKINRLNRVAVITAFLGAAMVLNVLNSDFSEISGIGVCLGIVAGLCYAFYGIFSDIKLKEIPLEKYLFYMYFTATVTFWLLNPDFIIRPPEIEGAFEWTLIIMVVIMQVLPMALLNIAIRMIGSNRATVIATAELPFTVILAWILLDEGMSIIQIMGVLTVTAAVVMLHIKDN